MKAPAFAYARPASLDAALRLLERHGDGARILAGGQSLMPTLNMRLSAPDVLIDINRIPGLDTIALNDGVLRIGALARYAELERSRLVAQAAPLLARAVAQLANPGVRNRGTIGGSLAFADPAAELPACAVALGARIAATGPAGTRLIEAAAFFQGLYRTALLPGEIVTAVEIPAIGAATRQGYAKLARRHGDYAMIGLAAQVTLAERRATAARLVFFAAGDRPVEARAAAAALLAAPNLQQGGGAAAAALAGELDPPNDLQASAAMRVHLARVLLRRVLGEIVP